MQTSTNAVNTYGKQVGLNISKLKTKVIPVGNSQITSVALDGEKFSIVPNFQYLGSYISGDASVEKEINVEIGQAGAAYKDLENIWKQKSISLQQKLWFYNSVYCPLSCLVLRPGPLQLVKKNNLMPLARDACVAY